MNRSIATLAATSALLVGITAHASEDASTTFPMGRYQSGPNIMIFHPDGTFLGTTPENEDWVKGTYTHTGNQITVVDTWEGEAIRADGGDCVGKPGRYTWVRQGDVLKTTVVEDDCAGRKRGTDGVSWTYLR
ncbi:MAG: hypothetical protein ABW178_04410 [Pseudoxanthomonas sp.]